MVDLVRQHARATDSRWSKTLLDEWDRAAGQFWQVFAPKEMLTRLAHPLDDAEVMEAAE
ncbi:hypothetical protein AB5I41_16300 [Sphingomonas sp. MMS24-JH45]